MRLFVFLDATLVSLAFDLYHGYNMEDDGHTYIFTSDFILHRFIYEIPTVDDLKLPISFTF
jgi:hypothetical protein